MRNLICRFGLILQICGILALGAIGANGQTFSNGGGLANGVIFGDVGWSGQVASVNVAGRIWIVDLQPPQNTLLPDLFLLPGTTDLGTPTLGTYATIRIDGGFPPNGATTQPGWDLIFGDVGVNGATNQGAWTRPPVILGNKLIAQWVTLPGGVATNPIPPIEVNLEMYLVHDVAVLHFTVVNRDLRAHSVGIRLAQDYNLPGQNDFANYQYGPIITNDGRIFCSDFDLRGVNVPKSWQQVMASVKDSQTGELSSVGGILIPTNAPANFIRPDRFVVGYGNFILQDPTQNDFWNPIPSGLGPLNLCAPSLLAGAATFFSPRLSVPGQALDFTTYIGKAKSSIDFNAPMAAGVQSPGVVDPTKPFGTVPPNDTPGEFTIQAFVRNLAPLPLNNVRADLTLPAGLTLAPGEVRQKPLNVSGVVNPEGEGATQWQVIADGTVSGKLTYSVAFVAGPGNLGKSVSRDVDVPAIPTVTFGSTLQMVSFPFIFDDPTPAVALGLDPLTFDLIKWNPVINQYEAATRIDIGQGYWLILHPTSGSTVKLNLQGARALTQTTPFEIALPKGWSQIGNPWSLPISANQIQVITTDSNDPNYLVPQTVEQAAAKGWIASTIYWYDPVSGMYKFDQTLTAPLVPFQGYWVKSNRTNISLLISPPVTRAARIPTTRSGSSNGLAQTNDWKLRIEAKTAGSTDGWNFIGVSPNSDDAYDRWDAEKPPAINNHVSLGFVRSSWGQGRAGVYAQDLQQGNGGRKQWNMSVATPKPDTEVTLSWPEFTRVPRGYELYITDNATGRRQAMRQTSSIRVNSGSTSTRSFTITAEPRHQGVFRITNLVVSGTRAGSGRSSASIMFNATQDASVQVRITAAGGKSVRNLVTRAASAGVMQLTWDYKDDRGVNIPAGQYVIDVKGTTSDGQSAHMVAPHVVTR